MKSKFFTLFNIFSLSFRIIFYIKPLTVEKERLSYRLITENMRTNICQKPNQTFYLSQCLRNKCWEHMFMTVCFPKTKKTCSVMNCASFLRSLRHRQMLFTVGQMVQRPTNTALLAPATYQVPMFKKFWCAKEGYLIHRFFYFREKYLLFWRKLWPNGDLSMTEFLSLRILCSVPSYWL